MTDQPSVPWLPLERLILSCLFVYVSRYDGETERVDRNVDVIYFAIVVLPLPGDLTIRGSDFLLAIGHHIPLRQA